MSAIFVQLASLSNKAGFGLHLRLHCSREASISYKAGKQETSSRNPRVTLKKPQKGVEHQIHDRNQKQKSSLSLSLQRETFPAVAFLLSSVARRQERVPSCSSNHLQLPAESLNQRFVSDLALVESLHFKRRENCFFPAGKHLSTRDTPLLHRQTQLPDEIQSINISGCLFLRVNLFCPFEEKTNPILLVKRCEIAANYLF